MNQSPSDAAMAFESPAWLAIASGRESYRHVQSPVIDMTKIAPNEGEPGADLQGILATVDPAAEILHITGAVPDNDQWEALGQYFTNLRFLRVDSGWNEDWIDDKFPLNWPLELLLISDAGGELVTTPVITQGRVKQLVFLFTCELRFEGPTTKDLMKDAEQLHFIPHKEKAPDAESDHQGEATPEAGESKPSGAKIFFVPHEVNKWVYHEYMDGDFVLNPDLNADEPASAMTSLQILGNDALQMLTFMSLGKFHVVASLEDLTLDSRGGNDLIHFPPSLFLAILSSLARLKHLKLTLGSDEYAALLDGAEGKPFLQAALPAHLETLHFRGPVSMLPHLDAFAAAFASDDFLPSLRRISFVLDQPDEGSDSPKEPSLEQLRAAHAGCTRVLATAAARGVVVDDFCEPWVEEHSGLFSPVDNRWAVLDSIASS